MIFNKHSGGGLLVFVAGWQGTKKDWLCYTNTCRDKHYLLLEGAIVKQALGLGQQPPSAICARKPSTENIIRHPGQNTMQVLIKCHTSGETPSTELNVCIPHPIMESLNSQCVNGAGLETG